MHLSYANDAPVKEFARDLRWRAIVLFDVKHLFFHLLLARRAEADRLPPQVIQCVGPRIFCARAVKLGGGWRRILLQAAFHGALSIEETGV